MEVNHGEFDHVGRTALNGGIDSVAFGPGADGIVGGTDVADVTAAASDGLDVAALASEGDGVVHVFADAWKLVEVLVNDIGGFFARDAEALG